MIVLENRTAKVFISQNGAQAVNFIDKETDTDIVWNGSEAYWAYHNPVLFPIVGSLWNNEYIIDDQKYHLGNHGFARNCVFSVMSSSDHDAALSLRYNDETMKQYPFKFELIVSYQLTNKKLSMHYRINNLDHKDMPYQIGFHPAFNCPLDHESRFDDYYLEFEQIENDHNRDQSVWIDNTNKILFRNNEPFAVRKASFFYNLKSNYVDLTDGNRRIRVGIKDFVRFGIWHKTKDTPFVCLEPQNGEGDYQPENAGFYERKHTRIIKPHAGATADYYIEIIR